MDTTVQKDRAKEIVRLLEQYYPKRSASLRAHKPLEILVATMLSAQSTDIQVNRVTSKLFQKYPSVEAFANANLSELQQDIFIVGYYRQKAKHLQATCQMLIDEFDGVVPRTMDELVKLPGVGRKTANIILNRAFGIIEGIAVDTHVFRIAHRLGLSNGRTSNKVEQDLMTILPRELWGRINRLFIIHGRQLCQARRPKCEICPVAALCPFAAALLPI